MFVSGLERTGDLFDLNRRKRETETYDHYNAYFGYNHLLFTRLHQNSGRLILFHAALIFQENNNSECLITGKLIAMLK